MDKKDALSLLDSMSVQTSSSLATYASTSNKAYDELVKHINVTSYSQLEEFYRCPRKFQKRKEQAATGGSRDFSNIDFAFGHAVGAGVQNYLITEDINTALFNAVMAWNIDFFMEAPKKRKSLWNAMIAVEKFAFQARTDLLDEWELLYLPSGKPAIETSFSLHCGSGFKHYLHMDVALKNRRSKKIAVVDVKTTGFGEPEEALYANSSQALSYSICLEHALQTELASYEVFYLVYSSPERTWQLLPFAKSGLEQAEYIKDLLLTQNTIRTYNEMRFYPKRGQACYDFRRRCEYFGECNITADEPLPELDEDKEAEKVDYVVDLIAVIERLKQRKKEQR